MRNFFLITLLALMALEATLAAPSDRKKDDLTKSGGEIPRISHNVNVKTSRRRNAGPAISPGVQSHVLRDESVGNNGHIERVSLNRVSALDGSVDEVKVETERPGIFAYGMPKRILENNGFIERVRHIEDEEKSGKRVARSVQQLREQSADLEVQEAKLGRDF